ncbi:bifunctional phosphopantothenoylcysteine decarboxylase/phosphopantothenate--cysteine ligase CoaBC [Pampinifervens florentissimum]|uniref:bifunctional phosphopantothenoylcysteine decarboxylase/phosphopantothenate--cysteine ligase CoaBC n=1 Tax=Pampinifervens florentissimum TaxID=1632019 RepID=UPI0013B47C4D|nr:bifunctional phosphopantothenoylcysteine decarboxylase/phosphopantothenate--cysteine ligase CoaBC [Hydrogenobacter sp. T-8]QID32254.1 bifunctional phosphopantothenoylcysteine decarboxylase/phosphopantothenate--cysteine ligase CoaBC [Hydrogenobacter sp. T-8]
MAKILLGVSSSIAIYKACELVRELIKSGHEVRVVMSPFSERFISRLTFEALSGNKAYVDWEDDPLLHINLPRWSDLFVIAPCSINTLSKIALGIGDNLLTTCALSHKGKLLLAPAGNVEMYKNPAVQENIKRLRERGVILVEPEEGRLICQEEGQGRLASIQRLLDWIEYALRPKPLEGKRVLITAGATREFIDSVRFISNLSSGLMGFSLARVFRWYGAQVKVIAGFTTAEEPPEVEIVRVLSAKEMYEKVMDLKDWADIIVMNSAVADYRPLETYEGKLKKQERLTLELVKNPDILAELGRLKKDYVLIGFALEERQKLQENALKKLQDKNLDVIVANPLESMGSEQYEGIILFKEGKAINLKASNKLQASELMVKELVKILAP